MKWLSTTALALTLAFSGAAYAHDEDHGGPMGDHMGPPPFMEEAISKLPDKDAEQFRDTMRQSHDRDKPLHEEMHKLHEDMYSILTADKFSKSAYIAKAKEMEKLHDKMESHHMEAFATAIAKLPKDERKTLADAMKEEHREHHEQMEKSGDEHQPSGDEAPADHTDKE